MGGDRKRGREEGMIMGNKQTKKKKLKLLLRFYQFFFYKNIHIFNLLPIGARIVEGVCGMEDVFCGCSFINVPMVVPLKMCLQMVRLVTAGSKFL